jgi:hypothetical protein
VSPRPQLTWADVRRRRLAAHRLTDPAPAADLVAVAGAVCGIHAQVMASAEVALGLRVDGATRSTVQAALWGDRSLVKTYGLRGTVHVYPAAELELWLTALRALPGPERRERDRLASSGVSAPQAAEIREEIAAAVAGRRVTLQELEAAVGERLGSHVTVRRGSAFGSGWSLVRSFLGDVMLAGSVCFGPNEGTRVTYVRPSDWLGRQARVDEAEALRTMVRRYLRAYGPTTETDFRQWTAATTEGARAAFDVLRDELVEVTVEGRRGWWLPDALEAAATSGPSAEASVLLLPHFDAYSVGSRPRDDLVPPPVQAAVADRGLTRAHMHANVPVLVVDGRVAGLWQRTVRSKTIEIRVEPIALDVTPALRRGVDEAARRVGAVLERVPAVEFGPVDARPHM